MKPEIRKLKIYYGNRISSLQEEIANLKSEIVRLNNIIQDSEYGLVDKGDQ